MNTLVFVRALPNNETHQILTVISVPPVRYNETHDTVFDAFVFDAMNYRLYKKDGQAKSSPKVKPKHIDGLLVVAHSSLISGPSLSTCRTQGPRAESSVHFLSIRTGL